MYPFGNDPAFAMWHRVVRRYDGVAGADVADFKELFRLAINYENSFLQMDYVLLIMKHPCCCMSNLVSCIACP